MGAPVIELLGGSEFRLRGPAFAGGGSTPWLRYGYSANAAVIIAME